MCPFRIQSEWMVHILIVHHHHRCVVSVSDKNLGKCRCSIVDKLKPLLQCLSKHHRQSLNLPQHNIKWKRECLQVGPDDRWLQEEGNDETV